MSETIAPAPLASSGAWPPVQDPSVCLFFDPRYQPTWVDVGSPAKLAFGAPLSIQAWVLCIDPSGVRPIVSRMDSAQPGAGFVLRVRDRTYEFGWLDGNGTLHGATADVPAEDGRNWVHLGGLYDGSTWRLYRNGELQATSTDAMGMSPSADPWLIGATDPDGATATWNRSLATICLWDRVLDEYELQQSAAMLVPTEGLRAHWPLHDGSGSTIADLAPDPAPGTARGHVTWRPTRGWFPIGGIPTQSGGDQLAQLIASAADGFCLVAPTRGEVWTSPDGASWTLVNDSPPFAGTWAPGVLAIAGRPGSPDGLTIYVVGGSDERGARSSVWRSLDVGRTWEKKDDAPWAPRSDMMTAGLPRPFNAFVLGGIAGGPDYDGPTCNDVWVLYQDGGEPKWECVTPGAAWEGRTRAAVAATGAGPRSLVLAAGDHSVGLFRDFWTTDDGVTWARERNSPFEARQRPRLEQVTLSDGRGAQILFGGWSDVAGFRDTWMRKNGTWTRIDNAVPWLPRGGGGSAVFHNRIVVAGGEGGPLYSEQAVWGLLPPED